MSKISNVITMMELLSSGRKYSIKELSEKLEVSERMIRLYKEELDKSGIYIDSIMGPYGGYVLNQSIRIPIRKFRMNDARILDKYIKSERDEKKRNELTLLQDKIKGVYVGSIQESIRYYSYGKGENDRVIDPAEMFLFQDGWYCAAYCELRKDMRHFELKRIINYELLDEKYE